MATTSGGAVASTRQAVSVTSDTVTFAPCAVVSMPPTPRSVPYVHPHGCCSRETSLPPPRITTGKVIVGATHGCAGDVRDVTFCVPAATSTVTCTGPPALATMLIFFSACAADSKAPARVAHGELSARPHTAESLADACALSKCTDADSALPGPRCKTRKRTTTHKPRINSILGTIGRL